MNTPGRKLLSQAADARESGKFHESLSFNDQALLAFENNALDFAEGIANRAVTLRVYANLQENDTILVLAKYEMIGAVTIARESGDTHALAIPLFNLAQVQEDLGEFTDAVSSYKEAVDAMTNHAPEHHNRPSVLANMKVHMIICEYKAGDVSALDRVNTALDELVAAHEPDTYSKDVWVSGAHMRLAAALKEADPEKAKEHLQQAKEIIDANEKLSMRKKQWEKLSSKF